MAIYRRGSVSAAAASRYMTQPALSQPLAVLEAEVGEPLYELWLVRRSADSADERLSAFADALAAGVAQPQ